jgi:integrase
MTGGSAVIRQRKDRDGLQVQVYAGRDPLTGRKRWTPPLWTPSTPAAPPRRQGRPAPSRERADTQPPAVEDAARLLRTAAAEDPELGLFLRLAVVLGARRGELCALRWLAHQGGSGRSR